MIRTLWYFVSLAATTVWYGSTTILASWFGAQWKPGGVYDRQQRGWGASSLRANGIKLDVSGLDRFPHDTPHVFASNHTSMVDIWALLAIVPGTSRFVAKQELLKVPFLGKAMYSAGHIFLDRKRLKSAFGAYDAAAETIRKGVSAVVFPEGTRSPDGALLPFKRAPFLLAIAAEVPVVPIYVHDAWKAIAPGSVKVHPGTVKVCFGDPISTKGMSPEDRDVLATRTRLAIEGDCGRPRRLPPTSTLYSIDYEHSHFHPWPRDPRQSRQSHRRGRHHPGQRGQGSRRGSQRRLHRRERGCRAA
jgi:1-acyl-sn-glycerol-3-phosphate acyltransferase